MAMRACWADVQNSAFQAAGIEATVDHRSLEDQAETALARGDEALAEALNRPPEPRMGVAATNIERKARNAALAVGDDYEPVTDRGRDLEAVRAARRELEEARLATAHEY